MKPINAYIDHTILKPTATKAEIEKLCAEAKEFAFASVCINPAYVPLAKNLLAGSDVKICTVIGFPLGANRTEIKAAETEKAYLDGCDEFDMVINVGALKDGRDSDVLDDVRAVVKAAGGRTVKVIIEACLLSDEEKVRAVKLSCEAGAHFVKTSTGFSTGGATREDVALFAAHVPAGLKIKAAGGISSFADAEDFVRLGASRLGTSRLVKLIKAEEK